MSSNRADPASDRRPRAPLSITVRLAVLYAVSASVMLLVITAFLYWIQIQAMERDDFYFVVDKVFRLERALQEHPDDPGFLDREVKWKGEPHELEQSHTFYSRIIDDQGRLIVESSDMATLVPSEQFAPPLDLRSGSKPLDAVQRWRSPQGGPTACCRRERAPDKAVGRGSFRSRWPMPRQRRCVLHSAACGTRGAAPRNRGLRGPWRHGRAARHETAAGDRGGCRTHHGQSISTNASIRHAGPRNCERLQRH